MENSYVKIRHRTGLKTRIGVRKMKEDNFYPGEGNDTEEEQMKKAPSEKQRQGIYKEEISQKQGEYRQTAGGAWDAYGQDTAYQQPVQNVSQSENQGFGIASMVLGILSLVLFCACINIPLAIVAIIFGILQLTNRGTKKGMAIVGIVTAVLSMVLFGISVVALISSVDFQRELQRDIRERFGESFFDEYEFPDYYSDDPNTF